MSSAERTPLLPSDRPRQETLRARLKSSSVGQSSLPQPATSPTARSQSSDEPTSNDSIIVSTLGRARLRTHALLTSRVGHYSVLLLVTLDVACIFADFLISLYSCEHFCHSQDHAGAQQWENVQDVLSKVSVAFSTLFLVELLASVWAFGREFFQSKFRVFDAFVITTGFVLDVCLKGVLEEVGSIVVVLRFWRVFKLLEELGDAGMESIEKMEEKMIALERENESLSKRLGMSTDDHDDRRDV